MVKSTVTNAELVLKNQQETLKKDSTFKQALAVFLKDRLAVVGTVIILIVTLCAVFAPVLAPYDPVSYTHLTLPR